MTKQEIRRQIRARKTLITPGQRLSAPGAVFAALERTAAFILSDRILLYASLPDELSTAEFLKKWQRRKQLFLPRVNGDNLEILPYRPTLLQPGAFNIEEPAGDDTADPRSIDLIIVPAMAFDRRRNRLGRGRGFYDRLLKGLRATTIGVAYDFQLLDLLPTEETDVALDMVITETHII